MKLKTMMILVVSCVLLAAIGLGTEDIYCSYFGGVRGLRRYDLVDDRNGVVTSYYLDDLKEIDGEYVNKLACWAEEHGSALVVQEPGSCGQAVFDGSGRIMKLLIAAGLPEGSPPMDGGMRGVYMANDPAFIEAFAADSVLLMPGGCGLPVLGYYDREKMPRSLQQTYFYPLSISGGHGEAFFTDAEEGIDELTELILENNEGKAVNCADDHGGALGFISLLFKDPMPSRDRSRTFFTISAIALSFVFSGLMLFREYERELDIRWRFGMTAGRLIGRVMLIASAAACVSLLLFAAGMENFDLIWLDKNEKLLLLGITAAIAALLEAAVTVIGMAGFLSKHGRRRSK